MAIFFPLTKLWSIMEEERNLITENDETSSVHKKLRCFLTILLVGLVFNLLVYQSCLTHFQQLSIIVHTRVKKILK